MARRRQVDDGKATMAEGYPRLRVLPDIGRIGPAMGKPLRLRRDDTAHRLGITANAEFYKTRNSTHDIG